MKKDTFFSGVGIVILVGIILLLANFIQLFVIIKCRQTAARSIDLRDERREQNNIIDQDRLETDRHGIELEEINVLENSMAKESG